eukprot:scaffold82566_cov63-Attheya_sp.AAC.1
MATTPTPRIYRYANMLDSLLPVQLSVSLDAHSIDFCPLCSMRVDSTPKDSTHSKIIRLSGYECFEPGPHARAWSARISENSTYSYTAKPRTN